jgi:tetratricopeptide (TPR) repeat protein
MSDSKRDAQILADEAMEASSAEAALKLARRALAIDPECTDARRMIVAITPGDLGIKIREMREIVEASGRGFGEKGFYLPSYLRALHQLAEMFMAAEKHGEAIQAYERVLELDEDDELGARSLLLALYLGERRAKEAGALLDRYPEEEDTMALFAWGRVIQRWLEGGEREARAALQAARSLNPFAEKYLSCEKELPKEMPGRYRLGDEQEAQVAAYELAIGWTKLPEFCEWLGERGS